MAEQLPSGRWLATRQRSGGVEMRILDTEEEALDFESR